MKIYKTKIHILSFNQGGRKHPIYTGYRPNIFFVQKFKIPKLTGKRIMLDEHDLKNSVNFDGTFYLIEKLAGENNYSVCLEFQINDLTSYKNLFNIFNFYICESAIIMGYGELGEEIKLEDSYEDESKININRLKEVFEFLRIHGIPENPTPEEREFLEKHGLT